MVSGGHNTSDTAERTALIHREIAQLIVLILVAVGAFVLTREVAASNREMNLRDAAEWYRRGQDAIAAGRVDDAVDALRRATVKDRADKRYLLALAQALALARDDDAARSVLVTLRESAPEDPDINLQLARLAAAHADVAGALRFYHSALYAAWPTEQIDARRDLRLELVRFLLAHNQANRAISELLALSSDIPDDPGRRVQVAQLFASAGDNGHALEQFQRVLRFAPENAQAAAGAGQAAFRLGDYAQARTYLRHASAGMDDVGTIRAVVDLVLSNDPLANRLGAAERRRRLVADFTYAQKRLRMCVQQDAGGQPRADDLALQEEALAFEARLEPHAALDQDTIESGFDVIGRIERVVAERCGPPTALDQALVLIGRQHRN